MLEYKDWVEMNRDNLHEILITKIQRFSLHDGPGIRTTVFVKGCSLRCPWCSNPENLSGNLQKFIKDGREGIYGSYYTTDDLYMEVMKDKLFYTGEIKEFYIKKVEYINNLPGGVSFSGGECLLQIDKLVSLFKRLKSENVHITVETCLFIPKKNLLQAIEYIDFFYVDVKILDEEKCQTCLCGNIELYLSNLDILLHSEKPVVIRVPVIGEYTDDDKNRRRVADLIAKYVADARANLLKVEIIKEHNLGTSKYQSLALCNEGYEVPEYKGVSDELMERYKQEIDEKIFGKIPVEICRI